MWFPLSLQECWEVSIIIPIYRWVNRGKDLPLNEVTHPMSCRDHMMHLGIEHSTFGCQKLLFIFFYHITLSLSSFITALSTGYTHTPWHVLGSGLFLVFSLPLSHIPTLLTKHSRLPYGFRPHPTPGSVTLLLLLLSRWVPQPSQGTLPLAGPCRAPRPPGSYTWWSEVELV